MHFLVKVKMINIFKCYSDMTISERVFKRGINHLNLVKLMKVVTQYNYVDLHCLMPSRCWFLFPGDRVEKIELMVSHFFV